MISGFISVTLGSLLGTVARYFVSGFVARRFGETFPYGTLLINVLGSFVIGFLLVLAATRLPIGEPMRLLLVTGLLGGFTTFSSFSFEVYTLLVAGSWSAAGLYVLGSVGAGIASVFLGAGLARMLP